MATNCESSTTHIDECEHAFLKNGVVEDVYVFTEADHGSELIERIKQEKGYDDVVCLCHYGSKVHRWSTWDGTKFTDPTLDYLYSIGVSNMNQAMHDASVAAEEAAK
jgi:hypothetical protein